MENRKTFLKAVAQVGLLSLSLFTGFENEKKS